MATPLAEPSSGMRAVRAALAAVVLAQAFGLLLSTRIAGTSVGTWLFLELRWQERASELFEWAGTLLTALASLAIVFVRRPLVRHAAAGIASCWYAALALAEWANGGAPFTELAVPAHATRITAPLVLAFWDRALAVRWILRASIASTFAAHGFEALGLHPGFVDYLLAADRNLLGLDLTQRGAELLLRGIGVHDLALATFALAGGRSRAVLGWMAFWGFVTAFSRVVQGGEAAAHLALIRVANGGLPLVLLLRSGESSMARNTFRRAGRLARAPLLLLLFVVPQLASAQALGDGPGHLRVTWTEDPAHRATISWSTPTLGSTSEVHIDTQPRGGQVGSYARTITAANNGEYTTGGAFYHHAEVTGLQPSTTYYFVVVTDGQASEEHHFVTAPVDDRPFRLLYGGDSRKPGEEDRRAMNRLIARLVEEDPGIIALAHGGDYIQSEDSWEEWDSWMADHALTFTRDGRILPIIPARGNHEGDAVMFNEVFGFPAGPQLDYWVTRIGANAAIVNLDTNISIGGDQTAWLEEQLQALQEVRWILPSYHRPAYPAHKEPSGARQFWVPLFEEYDVDVVLESDGHVLKRTVPIRNEQHDPTGVVYIGEGGLGVPQREPNEEWYLEPPGMAVGAHHVQRFSFTPEQLTYEALLMDGSVADTWTFAPKRAGTVVETPETPGESPDGEFAPVAVDSVRARSTTEVAVTFSVEMDEGTTADVSAYRIEPKAEVREARMEDANTVLLTTTELLPTASYDLQIHGVTSADGQAMRPVIVTFSVPAEGAASDAPPRITPAAQGGGCATAEGAVAWGGAVVLAWALALVRRR